jgi:transcriptional regulator with XRE-family HTH domain
LGEEIRVPYQKVLTEQSILRRARTKLGLSQQRVADMAQIHMQQYQKFEAGTRDLSTARFYIACRVLEVLELDITRYFHGDYVLSEEYYDLPLKEEDVKNAEE